MAMTLDQLSRNQKAKIVAILGNGKLRKRLLEMGLTPGTIIYIQKTAPWKDPIEISVRNYVLAFRKSIAKMIVVEVI